MDQKKSIESSIGINDHEICPINTYFDNLFPTDCLLLNSFDPKSRNNLNGPSNSQNAKKQERQSVYEQYMMLFEIGSIGNINKLFTNFQNNNQKEKIELIYFSQTIINLFYFQNFILIQLVILIQKISIQLNSNTQNNQSPCIESCYLTQTQELFFTNKPEESSNRNQNIQKLFEDIISIIRKKMSIFDKINDKFNTNGEYNISRYFETKINELDEIIKKNTIKDLIQKDLLENFLKNIKGNLIIIEPKYNLNNTIMNKDFKALLNASKTRFVLNFSNLIKQIDSIFSNYKDFYSYSPQKQFYLDYLYILLKNNIVPANKELENPENLIKKIQEDGNFFCIEILNQLLFENLIRSDYLSKKINESINIEDKSPPELESSTFNNTTSSVRLIYDSKFHFFLQFDNDLGEKNETESGENEILKSNISKFIVHCNKYDKMNRIIIPYYSLGTVYSSFFVEKIQFSLVDKFIILYEVAKALSDLHSNNKYHGNLYNKSIYLDSYKNAYLGFFSNKKKELHSRMNPELYFQAPETFEPKNDKKEIVLKLIDIYSFGVMMFEIITEVSIETIFEKSSGMSKDKKMKKLKENYCEFLFGYENLGNCIDNYMDFYGNTTKGMKMIIENCMKINPKERFQSMNEIIEFLKNLPIYEKNRQEIEYRFNSSRDSRNYNCSISDVIIGYYLGYKEDNLKLIQDIYAKKGSKLDLEKDIIYQILKTFNICYSENVKGSKLKYIVSLLNFAKKEKIISSSNVLEEIENFFDFYFPYRFSIPSKEILYNNFFQILKDNEEKLGINLEEDSLTYSKIDENFKSIISKIINNEITGNSRYYYLDYFVNNIFDKFLNSQIVQNKLKKAITFDESENQYENDQIRYLDIDDTLIYSEPSYSARVYLDSELSYVLSIRYNENLDQSIIDREKKIYQSNISKFVVHYLNSDKNRNNIIIIPYFSLGTINYLIDKVSQNDNSELKLTTLDKFTILYEVAIGLKDLHSKNEYHGNLWGQSIFLTSSKDAYIGYFSYDRKTEPNGSKSKGPIYYRAPEVAEKFDYIPKREDYQDYVKMQQLGDIYSFGVIMHAILTDILPEKRFGNMPRDPRMKTVQGNEYFTFLTTGDKNDFFKDEGQETLKIIEKCMSPNLNQRYKSMKEVIEALEKDPHYQIYEKEIKYRLKIAKASEKVRIYLSDVVCSFYRGQEAASKKIIERTLSKYQELQTFIIPDNEEIMTTIFDLLDMKSKESESFNDLFDFIILNHTVHQIDEKFTTNFSDKLIELSIKINNKAYEDRKLTLLTEGLVNVITPVSTLQNFIKKSTYIQSTNKTIFFTYLISKELSLIHSFDMFHGEISMDSIGVYYNSKTKSFMPSMIAFYYFYIGSKNDQFSISNHIDNFNINKYQTSDIKRLKKIINILITDERILDLIDESETINQITYILYNSLINTKDDKIIDNLSYFNYKYFVITYLDLIEMIEISNDEKINYLSLDIENILKDSITYLKNTLSNMKNKLSYTLPQITPQIKTIQETKELNFKLIKDLHKDIQIKVFELSKKFYEMLRIEYRGNEEYSSKFIIDDTSITYIFIRKNKPEENQIENKKFETQKKKREKQDRKWFYKLNLRRLEIGEMCVSSAVFLMRRYLMNLNPKLNFKITVKILNKVYSDYQDKPIRAEPLIKICESCGYNDAVVVDGNIIITIRNIKRETQNNNDNNNNNNNNNDNDNDE